MLEVKHLVPLCKLCILFIKKYCIFIISERKSIFSCILKINEKIKIENYCCASRESALKKNDVTAVLFSPYCAFTLLLSLLANRKTFPHITEGAGGVMGGHAKKRM